MSTTPQRPKWAQTLTSAEWRHIQDTGPIGTRCPTLRILMETLKHQAQLRAMYPYSEYPCDTCRIIARKLGLVV